MHIVKESPIVQVKEHPILFRTEMVQAIIAGNKTMTRRIINPQPYWREIWGNASIAGSTKLEYEGFVYRKNLIGNIEKDTSKLIGFCPYGRIGDNLWVRESFQVYKDKYYFKASPDEIKNGQWGKDTIPIDYPEFNINNYSWKPSIHMPRKACRFVLPLVNIRIERLHDISGEDAVAEGVESTNEFNSKEPYLHQYKNYLDGRFDMDANGSFMTLFQSIHGEEIWKLNPWVWVIEFKGMKNG